MFVYRLIQLHCTSTQVCSKERVFPAFAPRVTDRWDKQTDKQWRCNLCVNLLSAQTGDTITFSTTFPSVVVKKLIFTRL